MSVVWSETRKLAGGMALLAGRFCWYSQCLNVLPAGCGGPCGGLRVGALHFAMTGGSVVLAISRSPRGAQGVSTLLFLLRYALTGLYIYLAVTTPFLQPVAAVVPLFFPQILLLAQGVLPRRHGEKR
ncbi:MAG: hypothetical protein ACLSAP_08095 [Oscillospiraceae bacterium]